MGKAEGKIESFLDTCIKELGGFTRKYTSPGRKGVPDRICFLNGVFFVETKTPIGELSVIQKREHARMRNQGAQVWVLSSIRDVKIFMANYCTENL